MTKGFLTRYLIALKVLPIVGLIIGIKLIAHNYAVESISLNPLFSGIVAANVFLMGFLLSGVMADYKESEKLPGELAVSLEAMMDEVAIIEGSGKNLPAKECQKHIMELALALKKWFFKEERTNEVYAKLTALNAYFLAFEAGIQANFIARLKHEQSSLRRIVTRVHSIRETSFVSSGYAVAEITSILLCLGLILLKIDPFYESLFFVGVISFLMVYLLILIKELDNPFGYYEHAAAEHVSLHPLDDLIGRKKGV